MVWLHNILFPHRYCNVSMCNSHIAGHTVQCQVWQMNSNMNFFYCLIQKGNSQGFHFHDYNKSLSFKPAIFHYHFIDEDDDISFQHRHRNVRMFQLSGRHRRPRGDASRAACNISSVCFSDNSKSRHLFTKILHLVKR